MVFIKTGYTHPVATQRDIPICFNYGNSEEDARNDWERRKTCIEGDVFASLATPSPTLSVKEDVKMENPYSHKTSHDSIIDVIKLIGSILVMLIHTSIFSDRGSFLWQIDAIARLAVPFFIICSGYYFASKVSFTNANVLEKTESLSYIKAYLSKLMRMYLFWAIVYLLVSIPRWRETGWFSPMAFIDWGISLFLNGSYFHLWYVLYMCYAVIISTTLALYIPIKKYLPCILFLYIIEVAQYGYRIFLPDFFQTGVSLFDRFPCLSATTRVVPFFMLGMYISYNSTVKHKWDTLGFVGCFIGLIIERNVLRLHGLDAVSYILFTLPTSFFLFRMIITHSNSCKNKDLRILGQMSMYIYLIHPLFLEATKLLPIKSEVIWSILWMVLSVICSYVFVIVKKRFHATLKRLRNEAYE